jgi:Sugar-transfer associated ATP-grasp
MSMSTMAAVLPPLSFANATEVGNNARRLFHEAKLMGGPRHPPTRAIRYPAARAIMAMAAVIGLAAYAGTNLKRAVQIPVYRQMLDMTRLWFDRGIDPPSYYALELWRKERAQDTKSYLTRYETKNGLFSKLNRRLAKPYAGNEMADKLLFSSICRANNIAQAATLLHVNDGKLTFHCHDDALDCDLFAKPRNGMGAVNTHAFRCIGKGQHVLPHGEVVSRDGLKAYLITKSKAGPMIVQQWLRNHAALADFADQSLLTLRVITCLDESGEPEACLAMLRLLSKLEPAWKYKVSDDEYASPVDMATGILGSMTGDSLRTSHSRFIHHPVTKAVIPGRPMPLWQETLELARATHRVFKHRALVGWDIAITPEGPVVLEGNSNFDVMFLQRVHDAPIGHSRLGELLNFQLALLAEKTKLMV